MGAIQPHKTATDTDSAWDGPGEVAKAEEDEATLRYMHAWVNPDGDPDTKTAYKFPHHAAGTDTPANINGVNNALARLSQADIPEGDRAGVEEHLKAHRKDAGLEDVARRREPIRCFDGNAKPHEPFWTFRNVAEGAEPEMELYGYISQYSWFEDEITPRMFKDDLYRVGNSGPITIRMNSYGGDVIAASVMRSIIQDYPGFVTVRIDGIAASAATVVAAAGDAVKMQDTAYYMIHDPLVLFFLAVLNIEDLARLLGELKNVKDGIINAYEAKTHLSRTRLSGMMANETWMSAQEAVDLGFADEIVQAPKKAKQQEPAASLQNVAMINTLKNYMNVPAELLKRLQPVNVQPAIRQEPIPDNGELIKATDRLRAEVKLLKKE